MSISWGKSRMVKKGKGGKIKGESKVYICLGYWVMGIKYDLQNTSQQEVGFHPSMDGWIDQKLILGKKKVECTFPLPPFHLSALKQLENRGRGRGKGRGRKREDSSTPPLKLWPDNYQHVIQKDSRSLKDTIQIYNLCVIAVCVHDCMCVLSKKKSDPIRKECNRWMMNDRWNEYNHSIFCIKN